MTTTTLPLSAADRELHAQIGVTLDVLLRKQIHRVEDREGRELLCINGRPGRRDGIIYPYLDHVDHRVVGRRLRRDHPQVEGGKTKNKYLSAVGDQRHLFFPVGAGFLLTDTSAPVIFVEAEKSALATWCAADRIGRRVLPIGLGGCYGWRGRIGKTVDENGARIDEVGPLPDLYRIDWSGRDAIALFDARPNASVTAARQQFARVLRQLVRP